MNRVRLPLHSTSRARAGFSVVLLFLVPVLLAGCEQRRSLAPAGQSGELPDSGSRGLRHHRNQLGCRGVELYAQQAAIFDVRNTITAHGVRVDFYDDKGKSSSQLTAREVRSNQVTRDMTARGNVVLQNSDGARMTTQSLRFLNNAQKNRLGRAGPGRAEGQRADRRRLRERSRPQALPVPYPGDGHGAQQGRNAARSRAEEAMSDAIMTAPADSPDARARTGGLRHRGRAPGAALRQVAGRERRLDPRAPRRSGGPARTERRRQDHFVLHDRRPPAAELGSHPARRRRHHRGADVPPRAARPRLSRAGAEHLPAAQRA